MFVHTLTGIALLVGGLCAFWCIIILAWKIDQRERQMVVYIYSCPTHGKMELRLPVDHGVVECPKCGAVMRRIYTPTVAIYKGGDWTNARKR
jgi:predicted nucleic acid-binding Zn ribbon protein